MQKMLEEVWLQTVRLQKKLMVKRMLEYMRCTTHSLFVLMSLFLSELTDPDGVVHPVELHPVEVVTLVLIPSTQSTLKVT